MPQPRSFIFRCLSDSHWTPRACYEPRFTTGQNLSTWVSNIKAQRPPYLEAFWLANLHSLSFFVSLLSSPGLSRWLKENQVLPRLFIVSSFLLTATN